MDGEGTRTGDRARFEALVLPHLPAAYNLARWLTRNDHDARDVVQEAFLRAFRAFHGFRGIEARPWLLAIVRNSGYTWLRARRGFDAAAALQDDDLSDDTGRADLLDPAEVLSRAQDPARVHRALEAVPLRFREALVLRELEELSYREIATVLAVPIGTVMSRLARGRALLALELTGPNP